MDVYLFDRTRPLYRRVPLAADFRTLAVSPLRTIVELSRGVVDWRFLLCHESTPVDRVVQRVWEKVERRLSFLGDADDGAMNARGSFVFIGTGKPQPEGTVGFNCSGFVKWIVDGFYYPLTGSYVKIDAARERQPELRGNRWSASRETRRDPYFGLDWTRNLAVILEKARVGHVVDREGLDVRDSAVAVYTEDTGYPVEALELVLYEQTVRAPGAFFLGSVSERRGESPPLEQHFHTLAFFPFLTSSGFFVVRVAERGRSTTLSEIMRRYRGRFMHLVRVDARGEFDPWPHGEPTAAAETTASR